MDELIIILLIIIGLFLTTAMCWQESKRRKINFFFALFLCILLTPLFGYFIISSIGLRNAIGCKWCGNKENEAEYCGICKKNIDGEVRPF